MTNRYYLNNFSKSAITITLTAKRTIEPFTSLPLNNKDVEIFKLEKAKRKGKSSIFELDLRLSKFRIEDSANYEELSGKKSKSVVEDTKSKEQKEDTETNEPNKHPEDTKSKEQKEDTETNELNKHPEGAKSEEELAKEQLEQKAKEKAIAEEKAKIAKKLQKEAAKEGKTYTEEALAKAVEEVYAKTHGEN